MALTITKFGDQAVDYTSVTPQGLFTLGGDASYPLGGYAVTGTTFGFRLLAGVQPIGNNTAGFGLDPYYNTATQKVQILSNAQSNSGLAVTLGTATGTSTLSVCTAANLVTITAPNTLVAGQFVIFQGAANGNIAKANGQLVEISAATATTFSFTWAGIGGAVGSAADVGVTAQPVIAANGGLVVAGTATATPTTTVLTSNVGTITVANTFIVGQLVLLNGLTNASALNGYVVQVLTASATQFTFNLNIANVTTGAETTGSVIPMVAPGNAPIITGTSAAVTNSVLTSNVVSLTAQQNFPVNALVMVQGLTNGAALNGYTGAVIATSLTNALFKYNFNHANITTGADATGVASLLIVGGTGTAAEVTAGTNISAGTWLVQVVGQR